MLAAPPVQVQVTGALTAVSPARVSVGRTSCAIPRSLEGRAGRFVVSDPVRILCVGGKLRSIVYAPPTANESGRPSTTTAPAPAQHPATGVSSYFMTSSAAGPVVYVATGTLDEVAGDDIEAGGLTCLIARPIYDLLDEFVHVGDHVTIGCNGGDTLMRIATVNNG